MMMQAHFSLVIWLTLTSLKMWLSKKKMIVLELELEVDWIDNHGDWKSLSYLMVVSSDATTTAEVLVKKAVLV